jgi:serine/threonine protein kinase
LTRLRSSLMLTQKKELGMPDDLMLGRKIKGYQITEVLGRGGMGCVYRAQHPIIGKQVAIKILQGAQNPSVVSRFVLEAKAVNEIRHDNLIDILDFDQLEEGNPYIVMEYLEGRTLSDAIQEGPFPLAQVGHIVLQLCSALSAAHQKGIVHRDLKGDNIFLINRANQQNFVKVLDFGIAKLMDTSEENKHRTEANALLGTPLYMAPEQITGQPIDARTDIYTLGVLLYQMVTGYPPFNDQSPMVLLAMHVTATPPPPSQFAPYIPPTLETAILRCLQKNPDDRYPSMSQLATDIGAICGVDSTLYMGNTLMSQRLFTTDLPAVKAPAVKKDLFQDSPTEIGARSEDEDIKATIPLLPALSDSLLVSEETSPQNSSAIIEPTLSLESIDQLIDALEVKEPVKIEEVKPTTEMTREEILSMMTDEPNALQTLKRNALQTLKPNARQTPLPSPQPKISTLALLLVSLLLLGAGFGVWFFFFR